MLRKFNYTGRKRISRSSVRLVLLPRASEAPAFDAKISIGDMGLPGHARVYVEAYHKASYMRFGFGCVAQIQPPADRRLSEIDGGASALFRVKVVDEAGEHGQILAEVDGLTPLDAEQANANRLPLLPTIIKDLGHAVWSLDFGDDRPVLLLNSNIDNIHLIARSDDYFFTLVYPSVIQRVLLQILQVEDYCDLDGDRENDWKCQWLTFVCELPGIGPPPKPGSDGNVEALWETHMEWIDRATAAFCARHQVRDRFVRAHTART